METASNELLDFSFLSNLAAVCNVKQATCTCYLSVQGKTPRKLISFGFESCTDMVMHHIYHHLYMIKNCLL